MKRSSFIKRVLGLVATTIVAPQVLAEVQPKTAPNVPGVNWQTFNIPIRKELPVKGNIIIHRSGMYYYIMDVQGDTIKFCNCFARHQISEMSAETFLEDYMILASAASEI